MAIRAISLVFASYLWELGTYLLLQGKCGYTFLLDPQRKRSAVFQTKPTAHTGEDSFLSVESAKIPARFETIYYKSDKSILKCVHSNEIITILT